MLKSLYEIGHGTVRVSPTHSAQQNSAGCYTGCRILIIVMLTVVMPNVVTPIERNGQIVYSCETV
jgi:hypothetical protein